MTYRIAGPILMAALVGGCATVSGAGHRLGAAPSIGRLDVLSLLPLHPAADPLLRTDASTFAHTLTRRLRDAGFEARTVDVPGLVDRHALPVDVTVFDEGRGRHIDGALPEKALLALDEVSAGHRLVLFPAALVRDARSGLAVGTLRWRLEPSGGGRAAAAGILRYTADARGFPSARLAGELVAELDRLGVRGADTALD
ncbi:hypothetical protein [Luteibacter sahnii]|jgi:hypothetical protein|uniref:hypothetical protein n=1 Tax=Luteibacter sahnii TaxID=3021977 RepID=UPI002A699DA4|nr:hypothetical protein [Luteibacter sp. PPL193]MDY1548813.1 hypothetical protein [Luteibacter sp. PPL193]